MSSLEWVAGTSTPRKVYITRVWNFGTLEEWRRLWKEYAAADIEDVVRHPLRGSWTRHGKSFAETLCHCVMPDDVLISYDV